MTDSTPIETPFTEQDAQDFEKLLAEDGANYHPLLQVWREALAGAEDERTKPITPSWAVNVVSSYGEVTFADMPQFQELFYGNILELKKILDIEIESDDECLNRDTPAEDREENRAHYLNLLLQWQQAVLSWELEWDTTDPKAGVKLAALSEAHKLFFGQQGLVSHLGAINFEFSDSDAEEIADVLAEMKAAS